MTTPARSSRRPRSLAHSAARVAIIATALVAGLGAFISPAATQAYPEPSPAPVAWEIDLDYRHPRRIVVETPGQSPKAYWYLIYTVTNNSDQELFFVPAVELLTQDGKVFPANRNIPKAVFDAIQGRARSTSLTRPQDMSSKLLIGEDQAKTSVAIWEEPTPEMGTFDIFFGGLSGEIVALTAPDGTLLMDSEGNPIRVRKTRQLRYKIRGDDVRQEIDQVVPVLDTWVMR